jgi:mevalonate pyrophosphate decarboxylase
LHAKDVTWRSKKDKIGLFHNPATIKDTHLDKDSYKIIHPNFEVYENFISRTQLQDGTSLLVKFNKKKEDAKTEFTFEFFKLKDLEYNSFDAAQGLPQSTSTQAAIESLLASIAQGDSAHLDTLVRLIGQVAASENRSDQRAITALSDLSDTDMAAFIAMIRDGITTTLDDSYTTIGQAQTFTLPAPRSPAADE